MEGKGTFKGINRSWENGKIQLTFEFDQDVSSCVDDIKDGTLTIIVKKFRQKRSLDANNFYWQLLTKLADKLDVSNAYMHNILLRRYGQFEEMDGKLIYLVLPDSDNAETKALEAETYHIKPTSQTKPGADGMMYRTYIMLRGSSTYDTTEMSYLIKGLVYECREQGIETIPPGEIERMMDIYDGQWKKKHKGDGENG